jgi:hypothetical protein
MKEYLIPPPRVLVEGPCAMARDRLRSITVGNSTGRQGHAFLFQSSWNAEQEPDQLVLQSALFRSIL